MKKQQLFSAFLLLLLLQLSLQVVGQRSGMKEPCGVDEARRLGIKNDPTYLIREKETQAVIQRYMAEHYYSDSHPYRPEEAIDTANKVARKDTPAAVNSITSAFIQPQIDVLRNLTNYNMEHLPVKIIDSSSKPKSKTKKHTK